MELPKRLSEYCGRLKEAYYRGRATAQGKGNQPLSWAYYTAQLDDIVAVRRAYPEYSLLEAITYISGLNSGFKSEGKKYIGQLQTTGNQ